MISEVEYHRVFAGSSGPEGGCCSICRRLSWAFDLMEDSWKRDFKVGNE
jgi:hypothetical protein